MIGFTVVGFVVGSVLQEIFRAIRQSHRVVSVSIRAGGGERRSPTWREWWRAFRYDFCSSYSSLVIRFIEIPRDPSKPMRSRLRF
jgi:hypothetical protein